MYTSDLIEDFLEHLEIEAGRSKKTIENYFVTGNENPTAILTVSC